jgi:predicted glycosyltransferase involved in capsule biosynthesis
MRAAIIIPYRNRAENLKIFLPWISDYMSLGKTHFNVLVVEQLNKKPFNRGALMNVGFEYLQSSCDYFIFHDVDLLIQNKAFLYSFPLAPTHVAKYVEQFGYSVSSDYYGGVNIFNKEDFLHINGFSNKYLGWGGEDNDLNLRVLFKGMVWEQRPGIYFSLPHQRSYWDEKKKISLHSNYGKNKKRYQNMLARKINPDLDGVSQLKVR